MVEALRLGNRAAEIIDMQSAALRLHSIFHHAVNFIGRDKYLITVLEDSQGLSSQVVNISPSGLAYLISSLDRSEESINIKTLIDFKKAEIVYFNPPEQMAGIHYDMVRNNVLKCSELINASGNMSGFASSVLGKRTIYSKYVRRSLSIVKLAYKSRDKDGMAAALKHFVGLGPGLTPSGDDFICGLFSVLFYCHGPAELGMGWIMDVGHSVSEYARDNTTIIGYNMLRAYLHGELPERIHILMHCLLAWGKGNLSEAFCNILKTGSTSGSDTACGILFAFRLMGLYS